MSERRGMGMDGMRRPPEEVPPVDHVAKVEIPKTEGKAAEEAGPRFSEDTEVNGIDIEVRFVSRYANSDGEYELSLPQHLSDEYEVENIGLATANEEFAALYFEMAKELAQEERKGDYDGLFRTLDNILRPSVIREFAREKTRLAKEMVGANAERVAKLGEWPSHIQAEESLDARIPEDSDDDNAPGFDAGIAAAMDLIPRDKQELAVRLHANYSKEAVMRVREEAAKHDPDSETTWWLAASSICTEGGVDQAKFLKQIRDFKKLAEDSKERMEAAEATLEKMMKSFSEREGVPFGTEDGCIQGAYIAGYPFGSQYSKEYGIYFIGTYEDSLGLEDFAWSDTKDVDGRAASGPVFGSKQFVKCANEDEWRRAIEVVKAKLPLPERDDMPHREGEKKSGPTEAEIDAVAELQMIHRTASFVLEDRINDMNRFKGFAEGGTNEVRERYYPHWADADFETLLKKMTGIDNR